MNIQVTQFSDDGTKNPIVARIGFGLDEIIQTAKLSKAKKEKIKDCCLEIMQILLLAEKESKPLIEEINSIEQDLKINGVKTRGNGSIIETPGVMNLEKAQTFLKFAKQALQVLAKVIGIIEDQEFDSPRFHVIQKHINSKYGNDHDIAKILRGDEKWLKEIIDMRNEDEHPKSGKIFVQGYNIQLLANGKYSIDPPKFYNGRPLLKSLQVYQHNLLTFTEEIICLLLQTFFPPCAGVDEIPEDQRNPLNPKRYIVKTKMRYLPPETT
jgi:hypothetical protein